MHIASPQVHPVGERVGELRGDRADLAPDASEVVEQPRPLRRQLLEQGGEPEDVHVRPMIAHVSHVRRSVLFEIHVAGQLVNELLVGREFERRRLKVGAQVLLTHIARSGPITPGELERATGLRPSTLRERMQPLFDGELVCRVPSSDDRRSHTLEVTDRGRELLDLAEQAGRAGRGAAPGSAPRRLARRVPVGSRGVGASGPGCAR